LFEQKSKAEKEKKEQQTNKTKEKQQKKDEKQEKIEELTELVKRIQAEFENFKKREEKDREKFIEYSNAELIKDLLPVLDSIESAEKKAQEKEKKGIELIKKQLIQVLEKYGLKEIKAEGKKFNPEFHECLLQEHDKGKEDNIVLEELQKGYLLKDKVLRHAKVKINKSKNEEETKIPSQKKENKTNSFNAQR
jgi:molecular chaperone GrpE